MTKLSLERIAAKLHWLRSLGDPEADRQLAMPRYREALCFLQFASHQPGGLENFLDDFRNACPERCQHLPRKEVWNRSHLVVDMSSECKNEPPPPREAKPIKEFIHLDDLVQWVEIWCHEQNADYIGDCCFERFGRRFPGFLDHLCRFMDKHAHAELAQTADTSLRRKVLFELSFAGKSDPPVAMVFVADTRHGKTVAVETYCRAWPGQARLVTVPESNHERDFYAAYADAFGMGYTPATPTAQLKDRVQFTLRNAGLFLIHDEAHFLVPTHYHKGTPPQRLNWVRAQIIDRHLPCAFFCTPQSQDETLSRYVARTHHNMEQWLGRMPSPLLISDKPTYEDLMAVARHLFGDFPQVVLDELCDAATEKKHGDHARVNGESGFKIIEFAGARIKFLAKERGCKVTLDLAREGLDFAGAGIKAPADSEALRSSRAESASALVSPGRRGGIANGPPKGAPPAREMIPAGIGA